MRTDREYQAKIGYIDYTIKFVDRVDAGDSYGSCGYPSSRTHGNATIRVKKGQKRHFKYNTILHEILHAVMYTQGCHLNDVDDERVVNAMTNGIAAFAKANPKLMQMIVDGLKE